jgi:hypothetical protein
MTRKAVVHSTLQQRLHLNIQKTSSKVVFTGVVFNTSLAWRGIVEGNVRYLRDFLGIRGAGLQYLNLE